MESTITIESDTNSENLSNCSYLVLLKSMQGIKGQRSCRVIGDLEGEDFELGEKDIIESYNNYDSSGDFIKVYTFQAIKPGVTLKISDQHCQAANLYFLNLLPMSGLKPSCINMSISTMNETIYNYFCHNFGHSISVSSHWL